LNFKNTSPENNFFSLCWWWCEWCRSSTGFSSIVDSIYHYHKYKRWRDCSVTLLLLSSPHLFFKNLTNIEQSEAVIVLSLFRRLLRGQNFSKIMVIKTSLKFYLSFNKFVWMNGYCTDLQRKKWGSIPWWSYNVSPWPEGLVTTSYSLPSRST
jgi:hypothetical protein